LVPGKSTLARAISEKIGIKYISIGDLTRQEMASGSKLGKNIKYYFDNKLDYPDELLLPLIEDLIIKNINIGFIIDSYPKNKGEAQQLKKIAVKHKFILDLLIILEIDDAVVINRISRRNSTRSDDTNEIAVNRLEYYRRHIVPLIEDIKQISEQKLILDSNEDPNKLLSKVLNICR